MLPTLEVPAGVRALAAKSIDHIEQAFDLFYSSVSTSGMATEHLSIMSLTKDNMHATLDCARTVAQTAELQELLQIQTQYIKRLLLNAQQQMQQMEGPPPHDGG